MTAPIFTPTPLDGLPVDADGLVNTSAEFGETLVVEIEWNTDFDGREIDPAKEEYPRTLHGPFLDEAEAKAWMDAYPDDTDVHEMSAVTLNSVRPLN
jgi:hypothetical protein